MTKIKYVVHPGWVISQNDGQRHWVGYLRLVRLYRLNPIECIDYSNGHALQGWAPDVLKTFIHVYPRADGMYPTSEISDRWYW